MKDREGAAHAPNLGFSRWPLRLAEEQPPAERARRDGRTRRRFLRRGGPGCPSRFFCTCSDSERQEPPAANSSRLVDAETC